MGWQAFTCTGWRDTVFNPREVVGVRTWWQSLLKRNQIGSRPSTFVSWSRPRLECLETRLAPAIHTWTGASATSSNWSDAANWNGGAPSSSESEVALVFPVAARRENTDDIPNLTVQEIRFTGNDYVISGNQSIKLTGNITHFPEPSSTDTLNVNLIVDNMMFISIVYGATLRLGGVISGAGGLQIRQPSGPRQLGGTVILSGINTYQGPTEVPSGTLRMGVDNALPSTTAVTVMNPGSVLDLNNFNVSIGSLIAGITDLAKVAFGDEGRAKLTVGADNTSTLSGTVFSGKGSLIKVGTGTLQLSNLFCGVLEAITVNAGTLRVGGVTYANQYICTPTNGAVVKIASGATFQTSADAPIGPLAGAGNLFLTPFSAAAPALNLTVNIGPGQAGTFDGVISGAGSLTKTGEGTLKLTGRNTYSGSTTVSAGTLQAGAANTIPNASPLSVGSGATFDLNDFDQNINSISGAGNVRLGKGTWTTEDSGSTTFSGVISGTGSLVKIGTGLLSLTGTNTYAGATGVYAGTLQVGTASATGDVLPNSDVTIGPEGTLQGSGRVKSITTAGNVGSTPTGSVAVTGPCPENPTQSCTFPNPARGILLTSNAVFKPGSSFAVNIAGLVAGTGYSQLRVTGAASLAGSPVLKVTVGFHPIVGDTFTIIDTQRGIDGTFHGLPNGATITANNVTFRINYDSRVTLTVVPAPDANHRFVIQIYLDLLRRWPEPSGLSTWSTLLDNGTSRTDVVRAIEDSTEYRTLVVQSMYQSLLHRDGESDGVHLWVGFLDRGGSLERLREIFVSSPEYLQIRAGGTNSGFLDALYKDALNRGIDSNGRAGFGQALEAGNMSPAQVAAAVFESAEFRERSVGSIYQSYLHRDADSAGLQVFSELLKKGGLEQELIVLIIGSDEYFKRL
jgi:autotransporter-associated beta strand protein